MSHNEALDPLTAEQRQREFEDITRLAVSTYGRENQTRMLFEEMAELQNAICKLSRGRATEDEVCEEIADVMIMCRQMALIYGENRVKEWEDFKMSRLRERIDEYRKEFFTPKTAGS